MKILMVTEIFPNHLMPVFGTFCLERAHALSRLAEIKVVAAVPYFPQSHHLRRFARWHAWSQVRLHERIAGIDVYHPRRLVIPKVGGATSGWFYAEALERTLEALRKEYAFDVIDAHFVWPDGYAVSRAARMLRVPLCVTAHGTDLNFMPRFPTIRPLIRHALGTADRIVAVSRSLADIALQMGAEPEKLRVIPNGVDLDKFHRIDRQEARRELGLKRDNTILLAIGALIPRKGHEYLIEGLKLLIRGGVQNLQLIIIGEGPSRAALQELIRERGLQNFVTLQGQVPHAHLYKWLSAADLTCLTSSREGWPTVFFESFACGVPVVATAVNGAPEAISSPRYGVLIPGQDPRLVADAIRKALVTEWDSEALVDYASRNTWDHNALRAYAEFQALVTEQRIRANLIGFQH